MPARLCFIFLFTALFINGCSKGYSGNTLDIQGRWKLKETLMDPGDGSGTWKSAEVYGMPANLYIQFNDDGTMQSDASFLSTYDHYYTTPNFELYMIKASTHDTAFNHYHFEESKLIINPQCYEACGFKFVRIGQH